MTNHTFLTSAKKQPVCACSDANSSNCEPNISPANQDLIKSQAGSVLIGLGAMFKNSPAFSEHIDEHTADMLVSIGKKLKRS